MHSILSPFLSAFLHLFQPLSIFPIFFLFLSSCLPFVISSPLPACIHIFQFISISLFPSFLKFPILSIFLLSFQYYLSLFLSASLHFTHPLSISLIFSLILPSSPFLSSSNFSSLPPFLLSSLHFLLFSPFFSSLHFPPLLSSLHYSHPLSISLIRSPFFSPSLHLLPCWQGSVSEHEAWNAEDISSVYI